MSQATNSARRLRLVSCFAAIAAVPAVVIAVLEQRWFIVGLYACIGGSFLLAAYTAGRALHPAHKIVAYTLAAGSVLLLGVHLLTR
jgi:hypothetical protein